ncbi:MAG: hypothetical protein QME51_08825, partial [Planctomycetota bacterium]|nr:hypothetical protein [Planctomycetota bacterium]
MDKIELIKQKARNYTNSLGGYKPISQEPLPAEMIAQIMGEQIPTERRPSLFGLKEKPPEFRDLSGEMFANIPSIPMERLSAIAPTKTAGVLMPEKPLEYEQVKSLKSILKEELEKTKDPASLEEVKKEQELKSSLQAVDYYLKEQLKRPAGMTRPEAMVWRARKEQLEVMIEEPVEKLVSTVFRSIDALMTPLKPFTTPIRMLTGASLAEAQAKMAEEIQRPFVFLTEKYKLTGIPQTRAEEQLKMYEDIAKDVKRLPEFLESKGWPRWLGVSVGETGEMLPYFVTPGFAAQSILKGEKTAQGFGNLLKRTTTVALEKGDYKTLQKISNYLKEVRQQQSLLQKRIVSKVEGIPVKELTPEVMQRGAAGIPKKPKAIPPELKPVPAIVPPEKPPTITPPRKPPIVKPPITPISKYEGAYQPQFGKQLKEYREGLGGIQAELPGVIEKPILKGEQIKTPEAFKKEILEEPAGRLVQFK